MSVLSFRAQTRNPGDVSVVIPGTDPESRGCQCCHSGRRPGIQAALVLSFRAQTRNPGDVGLLSLGIRGRLALLCLPVKIDLPVYAELVGERTEIGTPKNVLYGHGDRPTSGKLSEEPVRLFLTFRAHGY